MHQDQHGHAMTTESAEAAKALGQGIHNFANWKAAVMPCIKAALEADPTFGFGHTVNGLLLLGAHNANYAGKVGEALTMAREHAGGGTPREALYLQALEASAVGRIDRAVAAYETILEAHPNDILAQRLTQMELFWLGEMDWSSDVSARMAPHWNESVPCYDTFLACRAFDLEETHNYTEAERLGRQAVELAPDNVWGTHAVAHVLIMQGRYQEGIEWLDGLKGNWAEANQMQLHLWWHRCLFHLERGETDAVLEIYDAYVRNREHPLLKAVPDLYIDLQNGASLLKRLELRGVEIGDRWGELAELTLNRLEDHTSAFTSAHFAMILAAAGRFSEAEQLLANMRAYAAEDRGPVGPRYSMAALPAAEAAIAHRKGEHEAVIAALMPARRMLWQMGGSDAQRDVFFLLLADSLVQTGKRDLLAIVLRDIASAGFTDPEGRIGYRQAAA